MPHFIQSFGQYIHESRDEEEEEKIRHHRAKKREQETHDRLLSTGGREGEEAEKRRHRAAKKSEQQRHVVDPKSKYIHSGKRTSTHEQYGGLNKD